MANQSELNKEKEMQISSRRKSIQQLYKEAGIEYQDTTKEWLGKSQ